MDFRRCITFTTGAAVLALTFIAMPAHAISEERSVERLSELVSTGWAMEEQRQSNDVHAVQACGDAMRVAQAEAQELRAEIAATPGLPMNLLTAASMANRCVSCLPGAATSCDEMEEQLSQASE
ncbi:MAG: hypothetical protein V7756_16495 [Halopseudomonas sp.]|uniref:hypothetical protein n=1 Tax=Halopseudomonas sp. TaxID=2901191 RepID=UPI003002B805